LRGNQAGGAEPRLEAAALSFGFDDRLSPWIGAALALLCAATAAFSRAVEREALLVAGGPPGEPSLTEL
jgi:hypothetical protein